MLLSSAAIAQQSISRTNEKVILESSRQAVSNYTKYLELLAQETDKDIIALYQAELFKSVQRDSVYVYNDLVPKEDRPAGVRENIDRLTTYLNDISTRYLDGVKIVYTNFVTSKVYMDSLHARLFVKVTADRSIDGTYYNKSQKKLHRQTEPIDFYVAVSLKSSGIPESRIYSIFLHENNEARFHPIRVVEKTAPIVIVNVQRDTVYRRGKEQILAWSGGEIFERLRLDLYRDIAGKKVKVADIDTSFVNDNKIKFPLSKKLKTGKSRRYFYQITKLSSEEAPIESERFHLKRKTPLIAQIVVPAVVVGGVAYLLLNKKDPSTDPVLPNPQNPE
jgi:hypothetical protein